MNIETRNLGPRGTEVREQEVLRALGPALQRFEERIRLVRVRFMPGGAGSATYCRVRVWCGRGPTVVIEKHAATSSEAVHAAADSLSTSLRRRWSGRRARQRRANAALRPLRHQEWS